MKESPRPFLSIIILNFNRKNDSLELLDSLRKQTYRSFETIWVDNYSTDGSLEAVKADYPQLKIIALAKNIGRAGHNQGAKIAQGKILVFLDADILLPPDFLGKVAAKFKKKNLNATSFFMKDFKGNRYGWEPNYLPAGNDQEGYESTFGGGMWAIRREIFEKIGGFNPDFFIYVDEWEYLIRLWQQGYSVRYFPDLVGFHKESPYAYRSIMKGYQVIINHAQIYALYLPVRLWLKFLCHHSQETVKILGSGEANRWGTIRGLSLALFFFLKALPKRKPLEGEALAKFLRFYFPKKGDVVVGKWGWEKNIKFKIKNLKFGISVVLPAFNEQENIRLCLAAVYAYLKSRFTDFEIIVVNDGSIDQTANLVLKFSQRHPRVRLVKHFKNLGYGAALRSGFAKAEKDLVFYTDSDNQFDIRELDLLLPEITKADIVAGYRINRQDPLMRIFIAWVYNFLMRLLFGLKIKDIDCSFKLYRKSVFKKIKLSADTGFIDAELFIKARKAGLSIIQVGVHHFSRLKGKTSYEAGSRNQIFAFVKPQVVIEIFKEIKKLWSELK